MSQSVGNIFRDTRENIVPYYSQNIRLKIIHYTCCLNLSSVVKTSEETFAASLGTKAKQIFFKHLRLLKKFVKSTDIQFHINVLGENPTKITISNESIDKQITLKRVYIYKIENTDLEIGFQAFY